LLDSIVKERWVDSFVSTEARILQQRQLLSSGYFQKLSKFPLQLQPLALRSTSRCSLAGGEFYSVTTGCQSPFFTAFDQLIETSSSPIKPDNYLINKEFSVSSAPEEVRIIDRFERPSTVNFIIL